MKPSAEEIAHSRLEKFVERTRKRRTIVTGARKAEDPANLLSATLSVVQF